MIFNNVYGQLSQYQGIVFDSETKKPIEFASVSVLGKDSAIVAGTVTDVNGKFQIKSERGSISIFRFQFMGYESLDFKPGEKTGNLPAIYLTASVSTFEEITVSGERKTQTVQIDKQIFELEFKFIISKWLQKLKVVCQNRLTIVCQRK